MTTLDSSYAAALPSRWRDSSFVRFVRTQPFGALGLLVIAIMAFAAALADLIAPYDPVAVDFSAMLAAPSKAHWFGTDAFGRDVLSRVMYGARTALAVGILSSATGCFIGAAIGITSAYFGGKIDLIVQSIIDILLSFPLIVLALVIAAVLGKARYAGVDWNLIAAIAIPMIPKVARVVRSSALTIREMAYIDAARIAEYSHARIIFLHIAPNVMAPFLIMFTAFIAQAILLEASLSFLGVGVSEPEPSWGLMLSGNNADLYRRAPWMVLFPGLAVSFAVFAFNILGDSLRDWLDPRLKV
jgi:peptide/nickel transport system permease protein